MGACASAPRDDPETDVDRARDDASARGYGASPSSSPGARERGANSSAGANANANARRADARGRAAGAPGASASARGVPPPRHWTREGAADEDALLERVRRLEREAREARERATTERRLHAVILAEERAARDGIVRGIRDERRMRELGVEGMDAEKLRGLRERGATHTSAGAVLDRRYIMGLVDETADLISLGSARRTGSSESPPKMSHAHAHDGREETQDSMSRTSMGSTLAAVSVVSVGGERYAEGMANALGSKADG
jgi:hypothetical protein